jgi:hypothetical protein
VTPGAWHPGITQKGFAVAFIVRASRGEATTTVRLGVVVAIARGQALAEEGWQVFIAAPDGIRYYPSEFDKLLSLSPALRSRSQFEARPHAGGQTRISNWPRPTNGPPADCPIPDKEPQAHAALCTATDNEIIYFFC